MNFGVRLPGPFRVGISDSGRMNVGVTAGPFSVSTAVGQHRQAGRAPFYPIALDEAAAELVVAGWRLRGYDGQVANVTKGWQARQVEAVPGGVTWRQVTSTRTVVAWTVVVLAVLAVCSAAFS